MRKKEKGNKQKYYGLVSEVKPWSSELYFRGSGSKLNRESYNLEELSPRIS